MVGASEMTGQGAALVTGAGRRVGAELAKHLARRGLHVTVHVNRSRDDGARLVDELRGMGATADLAICDLGDETAVRAMMRAFVDRTGFERFVVVNNASWFEHDFPGRASIDNLRASLAVHALAPFLIMEEAAKAAGDAAVDIFNILDQKLTAPNADYYSYTIGKYAMWGATRCWRTSGVARMRVIGLLPGILLTSGEQSVDNFIASREANPLRRAIEIGDLSSAIDLFLDNPALPGQDVVIDAGESLMGRRRDVAFDTQVHGD